MFFARLGFLAHDCRTGNRLFEPWGQTRVPVAPIFLRALSPFLALQRTKDAVMVRATLAMLAVAAGLSLASGCMNCGGHPWFGGRKGCPIPCEGGCCPCETGCMTDG